MALIGKGMYIWTLDDLLKGDQDKQVAMIQDLGLTWVAVKIANGYAVENQENNWRGKVTSDRAKDLTVRLHALGLQVWGWQYLYGTYPEGEARVALRRIRETGVDGFILNPEKEYKRRGMEVQALTYMRMMRGLSIPFGLSSYRYPEMHPELPWKAFLNNGINYHMPQVYYVTKPAFVNSISPETQLAKSMAQLRKLKDLPFIPAGAAYHESGDTVSVDAIKRFALECERLALPYFFWELRYLAENKEWYDAVKWVGGPIVPRPVPTPEPPALLRVRLFYRMKIRTFHSTNDSTVGVAVPGEYPATARWDNAPGESWARIDGGWVNVVLNGFKNGEWL